MVPSSSARECYHARCVAWRTENFKHRHARRARVIFFVCELKGCGDSNIHGTLYTVMIWFI